MSAERVSSASIVPAFVPDPSIEGAVWSGDGQLIVVTKTKLYILVRNLLLNGQSTVF